MNPRVLVRYWAAARDAAGTAEEEIAAATLAELVAAVTARHGDGLARVLARCSFVIDEQPAGTRDPAAVRLDGASVVEVLPPFAGG